MAGHNKWSKVKHIKGAADAKRGKLFSKLSREITVAAKEGGGDPTMNARLRQAIANAKTENMPNDTIDRAVKKGTGEIEGASYEEVCYEGFAPGGVALMIEVVTDNKNRSAADLRSLFSKNNGTMGGSGSVAYLFDRKGEIRIPASAISEDELLDVALEAGADDVVSDEDEHTVHTAFEQLAQVGNVLRERGIPVASQQPVFVPQTAVEVTDPSIAAQVLRLYEILDDYDDTQNVFANFDIPDDVLAQINA